MRKKTSIFIDEELWRKFKLKCVQEGKSISDKLEGLLTEALKERSGKP